jgi:co-chaperonin GroES (HSP10)
MIVPILHRILVRQFKLVEEDKTYKSARAAGIHLIESDQMGREQAGVDRGTVVSVGGTAFKDFGVDSPIAVGDMVAFARYSGKLLKDPFTEEEFIALNDEDIIAIYKE